jgi:hypothetical protein
MTVQSEQDMMDTITYFITSEKYNLYLHDFSYAF